MTKYTKDKRNCENNKEINNETEKEIEEARKEINSGKGYTHEQVKKRLGF